MPRQKRAQRAVLSMPVIVRTRQMIAGSDEHAAIVTRVLANSAVDVLLMPSGGEPYPVTSVPYAEHPSAGAVSWRFPPRS
jgi:hypothetical protein